MISIMHRTKMKRERLQIKGFTLLEALLVLSVTSFILLLFSSALTKTVHVVRSELFVLRFENLYKNTQEVAALRGHSTELSVTQGQLFADGVAISVPNEILIENFNVNFNEKGENSSLIKIQMRIPIENKKITYQLQMGSGKYKKTIS